jgi:transposase-like protein
VIKNQLSKRGGGKLKVQLCKRKNLNMTARAKQPELKGYQVCMEESVTRSEVKCPRCGSEAIYRYGKTHSGKPRFICVLCQRQFSVGIKKCEVQNRPGCPMCGRSMHIYKREKESIRFRCSGYPLCRTYKKIIAGGGER